MGMTGVIPVIIFYYITQVSTIDDKLYMTLLGIGSIIMSCYMLLVSIGKMPGYKKNPTKRFKIFGLSFFSIWIKLGVVIIFIAVFTF